MDPIVSVLVPAYNEEEYIEECIRSIATQETSFPTDIIVCDDASTDDTVCILQELTTKIDELRVIQNKKNQGIIKTRNRLLNSSDGQFFVQIDADSMMQTGTLSALYKKLIAGKQLVFGKIDVKNIAHLHPTAAKVGKIRGRGTCFGGACFASVTQEFIDSGGFNKEMIGAEIQELKQRAETLNWSVAYLEDAGVKSNFPTQFGPVLSRKYKSARTHILQYRDNPQKFTLWELRGQIFWTGFITLLITSMIFTQFALFAIILFIIPLYQYGQDAPLAASISGRPSFLILYPMYNIGAGLVRTVGLWTRFGTLIQILSSKYLQ